MKPTTIATRRMRTIAARPEIRATVSTEKRNRQPIVGCKYVVFVKVLTLPKKKDVREYPGVQ